MEIKEKKSSKYFLYISAVIANLLGFSGGLAYSWSSPVLPQLKSDSSNNPLPYPITPSEEAWIVGFVSLGAIFSPVLTGPTADKIGRKKTLLILAAPILAGYLMMAFATSVLTFYIARFIIGFSTGSIYLILPIYLTEIAEDHNRGFLGCLMGVFVALGLLCSYSVGPYLTVQNFCFVCTVPVIIFIPTFLIWNPETPIYLATTGDQEGLKESLVKLRNKTSSEIDKDIMVMNRSIEEISQNDGGIKELFQTHYLRKGLKITIGVVFFQQFCGINAVLSYMESIFAAAHSELPPEISAQMIGVIQVFANVVASCLADKLGRKILILISLAGSDLALLCLGTYFYLLENQFNVAPISWLPVTSLIVFIVSFNLGLASVPWTVMAEIFPPNVKAIALVLTVVFCFVGAFLTTLCFPSISLFMGMGPSFWLFAIFCTIGIGFVLTMLPETKGKSLPQIQRLLGLK